MICAGNFGNQGGGWQPSAFTTAADVSWWPKQSTWLSSGANVGYWSSSNEEWFQNRLSKIRQGLGTGKPLNAKEWRDALRYDKVTRKLMVEVESMSEKYCT